jgi:hypothetical protein
MASGLFSTVEVTTDGAGNSISIEFLETTYADFASLQSPTTITTSIQNTTVPLVIGPSGIGWNIPTVSGRPIPPPMETAPNPFSLDSPPPPASTATSSGNFDYGTLTHFTLFPTDPPIAITTGSMTYSKGGHDNDHHPILPPLCWFCPKKKPPNLVGWLLGGFKGPGIFPSGGPPAGFDIPFPEITVDPNGDPTFSSEPPESEPTSTNQQSSTSSGPCTTQTSPACTIDVSVWVPEDQSSTSTTTIVSTILGL